MGTGQNPALREAIAGALEWWREAGVDCAFHDDPVDWLAKESEALPAGAAGSLVPTKEPRPKPAAKPAERALQPPPRLDPANFPSSLQAFVAWWMDEPLLADGPAATRIPPRGTGQAELMVIVPEPEREDRTELLSGPQGQLLSAMLSAFGLAPEQVYFASAIPRSLPGADWETVKASGIGSVLCHHITLAEPKRVLVLGASALPLIGHDPPQGPADLRIFNHEGSNIPMLACRSLAALLEQPRWKARVWQAWLQFTA